MDKKSRDEFLEEVYKFQVVEGKRPGISKDPSKQEEYMDQLKLVKYWSEKGMIRITAQALGFTNFELTAYGIDYVESELLE